jgi:hypothetical protein
MSNKYIILLLIIFAVITFTVVSIDTSTTRQIAVKSQNLNFKADNSTKFEHNDVTISSRNAKINAATLDLKNKQMELENSQRNELSSKNVKFANSNADIDNTYAQYYNENNIEHNNFQNEAIKSYESVEKSKKNKQKNDSKISQRYIYKNIDWSTWKSDFVNTILDDSIHIHSLDTYKKNTWFFYSFYVTSTGEIQDISIKSFSLKDRDKNLIKQLIKSYEHQDITVFPANSNRTRAKVEALMILGDYEKRARPSDFNEREKVRLPY